MLRFDDQTMAVRVLVIGKCGQRVNAFISALQNENLSGIGVSSFHEIRVALQEFPSIRTVAFLYDDDAKDPMECLVFRIGEASKTSYCNALVNWIGWEIASEAIEQAA